MIVTTSVYVLEFSCLMVAAFGVSTLEQKALNLVGRVKCVAFLFVKLVGKLFQNAPNVSTIGFASFINHIAEDKHFPRTKNIGGRPVERPPAHAQPPGTPALGR